jgi:murein DD-endopeptidase MepM/ murein hydrolase activator NlpD
MSKFKFNKDLLDIVEDKLGIRGWVVRVFKYLIVSALLAVMYYIVFALLINTKEEEVLIKQNKLVENELEKVTRKMNRLDVVITELEKRDVAIYKGIFKADPPSLTAGGYSQNLFGQIDSSDDASIIKFTSSKIRSIEKLSSEGGDNINDIIKTIRALPPESLLRIPSIMPVEYIGPSQTGASIGKKIHPFYKTAAQHTGLDLLGSIGSPVFATADGVIRETVKADKGNGNRIVINHNGDYVTTYSHLSEILVRPGQQVKRGSVIAKVGNSGLSFAPHLHYEVIFKGKFQEPVNYFFGELTPGQLREMLIVALNSGQSLD